MSKPKLTPKERRLARKQRKDEQLRQSKRDHLQRELKYSRKTLQKYERIWKDLLIKISLPNLRKELEYTWCDFEHIIDIKDFTISLLMDELSYAEEQYMRNFSSHTENIDNLCKLFHEYLDLLREDFKTSLEQIQTTLNEFATELRTTHEANCEYLKTMIYCSDVEEANQERIMNIEYYGRMKVEQTKNDSNLENLNVYLDNRYQNLFNQTENFVTNFYKTIKKQKKEYNLMKYIDDNFKDLISNQSQRIQENYDIINKLKEKYYNMQRIGDGKLIDLAIERDFLLGDFNKLKINLKNELDIDKNIIIWLTQSCKNTEEYLDKLKHKCESLLNFITVCQRLEIKREILPLPACFDEIMDEMELFWQKVGRINCENLQMSKEISKLKQENQELTEKFLEQPDSPNLIKKNLKNVNVINCNLEMKKYEMWQK